MMTPGRRLGEPGSEFELTTFSDKDHLINFCKRLIDDDAFLEKFVSMSLSSEFVICIFAQG